MDNDIDPMKINGAPAGPGITPPAEGAPGPVGDTVAIPGDAPEANIPDTPMGDPGALDAPAGSSGEAPVEAPAEAPAEGPLPTDQSQWKQTTIIEGLGTPDQHEDQFWRYENFGVELDQSGAFEAYAIVDETPVMLGDGHYESFEEAVAGINEELSHKSLSDSKKEAPAEGAPAEDAPSEEGPEKETESEDTPKEESPAEKKESPAEKKEEPKEEKKEAPKEEKKDDDKKEDTGPSKKSASVRKSASGADSTDSIRCMMGSYWDTKIHSASNMPHTPRSLRDVAKAQNRTASVGGVTVRIGNGKDALSADPKGRPNRSDGKYKHVSPSILNAMAPVGGKSADTKAQDVDSAMGSEGSKGSANLKAPSVDDLYDKPAAAHGSTGVPRIEGVY